VHCSFVACNLIMKYCSILFGILSATQHFSVSLFILSSRSGARAARSACGAAGCATGMLDCADGSDEDPPFAPPSTAPPRAHQVPRGFELQCVAPYALCRWEQGPVWMRATRTPSSAPPLIAPPGARYTLLYCTVLYCTVFKYTALWFSTVQYCSAFDCSSRGQVRPLGCLRSYSYCVCILLYTVTAKYSTLQYYVMLCTF